MIGAIRSETLRLRRRTFGIGLVLMVVFAALGTLVVFTTATDVAIEGVAQPGGAAVTIADLAAADGFAAGLHFVASLIDIVALSYWAIAAATDYSSGLIRILVQAVPRRWPLVVGKVIALIGWTLLGTLAATAVASALAPAVAGSSGIDTAIVSGGTGDVTTSTGVILAAAFTLAAIGVSARRLMTSDIVQ